MKLHVLDATRRRKFWYFLGGITLFLFLIQVCTGVLLLLYYRPSANEAFESVQYIMTRVQFGWLIRSIHSWAANLMIFTAFGHMFSVVFLRAYRKPRELTWLTGMFLLFLAMGFGFSGYLLSVEHPSVLRHEGRNGNRRPGSRHRPPPDGSSARRRGRDRRNSHALFWTSCRDLARADDVLILVHLALVQYFGISVPPGVEARWKASPGDARQMTFFPSFFLRELMAWYIALGVLGALAALLPWELGTKADPFAPAPAGIRPEWYFMFQTLKKIPAKVCSWTVRSWGLLYSALQDFPGYCFPSSINWLGDAAGDS
jgi:quinol-cytochrome oxidoreductase complex cytochrome b subunit